MAAALVLLLFLLVLPIVVMGLLGVVALLLIGSERKPHPWETWGIDDEPKM